MNDPRQRHVCSDTTQSTATHTTTLDDGTQQPVLAIGKGIAI